MNGPSLFIQKTEGPGPRCSDHRIFLGTCRNCFLLHSSSDKEERVLAVGGKALEKTEHKVLEQICGIHFGWLG